MPKIKTENESGSITNEKMVKWLCGILALIVVSLVGATLNHLQENKVDKETYSIQTQEIKSKLDRMFTEQRTLNDKVERTVRVLEVHIATDN